MKKFAVIILALLSLTTANGQTIGLGEKTPKLKDAKWLNGNMPARSTYTYISFIHSLSQPCRELAETTYNTISQRDDISFILISRESATDIEQWVTRYISPRSGVIVDGEHLRRTLGISYAPFALIVDSKHRALWFGNPRMLNKELLEHLLSKQNRLLEKKTTKN